MNRVKAKDIKPGDRIYLTKNIYEVMGKKVVDGKIMLTARSIARTAPETKTSKYNPDTMIVTP